MRDPGTRKELFLDDQEIEAVDSLARSFHTPTPAVEGPILSSQWPWEGDSLSTQTVIFDPRVDRFRMWYQTYCESEITLAAAEEEAPLRHARFHYGVGYAESEDGIHWTRPTLVAAPDLNDPFMLQFYAAKPYRSGEFVILYVMSYAPAQAGHHAWVEVLASREGFHFTRVGDRHPWIDHGPAGSWNGGMIHATAPILHDGKLWIYASGTAEGHDAEVTHGAIGLYHFRPDGYVSFDAGPDGGGLTTRPMVWTHDHLHVNAAAASGEVAVEILPAEKARRFGHEPTSYGDYYPAAIEGFGRADCRAFHGDSTGAELTFGDASLSELKGRYVQLRFHLTNARIYSWSVL